MNQPAKQSVRERAARELKQKRNYSALSAFDIVKVLADAKLLAPEPDPMNGWRPINDCPKTSWSRLVWCPDRRNTYLVSWDMVDNRGWLIFGGNCLLTETPTMYRERPPVPPTTEPGSE